MASSCLTRRTAIEFGPAIHQPNVSPITNHLHFERIHLPRLNVFVSSETTALELHIDDRQEVELAHAGER